jgi:glycosyltransferase involved in cell wall biosynthesis
VDVLARRVPERAERIYHVPIGCTAEFIAESTSPPKPTPPKHLAEHLTGSKPTAGYIGTLGARFHHDLLADVATIRADTTFILGGKVPTPSDDFGWANGYHRLREMDHVHFIGWVPHEELDRYLMSFDVLLMPYAPCRFNRNACPAKLWDYMGTTRPIIANDVVPEVNMWSDVVHIADSPKSFASSIRGAVDEPSDIPSRRLEIARNHTYEALGERAGTIIKRHLHIPESE